MVAVVVAGCAAADDPRSSSAATEDRLMPACADLKCDMISCTTCYICGDNIQDEPTTACMCAWSGVREERVCNPDAPAQAL